MKLWLLRHGEAHPRAATDAERALTPAGAAAVARSADRLATTSFDIVLSSPYRRARQSAEIVSQRLSWPQAVQEVAWATPDGSPEEALRALDRLGQERVLLVTHNPFVGDLVGWLLHGHHQSPISVGTATLIGLEAPLPLAGGFELTDRFDP